MSHAHSLILARGPTDYPAFVMMWEAMHEAKASKTKQKRNLMECFEREFCHLSGFNFAASRDRENALLLAFWLARVALLADDACYRPPMVVVTGPPASGKSTLVRRFVDLFLNNRHVFYADRLDLLAFDQAARMGAKAVFVDGFAWKVGPELPRFITSNNWQFRPLKLRKTIVRPLQCVTILTTDKPLVMSADMARRSIHIRLKARKHIGKTGSPHQDYAYAFPNSM